MMNVGNTSGHRVLDRDHAEINVAGEERGKAIFKGGAGDRFVIRIGFATGNV